MSHETNEGQESNPVTSGSHGEVSNPKFGAASEPSESESGQAKAVSPQKLAANRANAARHSTGPKTPEGKEKSKQNSRKHGFFARQPLPRGEEGDKLWQAYSDLVAGIWEHYQPVGYMEGLLTEKIIAESIRFSRLLTYEAKDVAEDRAFHWQGIDRILRFQSAINRQLFQAIHELERLQDKRKAEAKPSNHVDQMPDEEGDESAAARTPTAPPRPHVPNCETNPTQADSGKLDSSAPWGTNCGTKPTSSAGSTEEEDRVFESLDL